MINEKRCTCTSRRLCINFISDSFCANGTLYIHIDVDQTDNYFKEDCMIIFLTPLLKIIHRYWLNDVIAAVLFLCFFFLSRLNFFSSRFLPLSQSMFVQGDMCIGVQHIRIRHGIHSCTCTQLLDIRMNWCNCGKKPKRNCWRRMTVKPPNILSLLFITALILYVLERSSCY